MLFGRMKTAWDAICLECGQCCCEKVLSKIIKSKNRRVPGVVSINRRYFIDFSRPCAYLDIESGSCLVYSARFRTCSSCIPMTIFHALFADYLPDDCAYVKKFRFWRK